MHSDDEFSYGSAHDEDMSEGEVPLDAAEEHGAEAGEDSDDPDPSSSTPDSASTGSGADPTSEEEDEAMGPGGPYASDPSSDDEGSSESEPHSSSSSSAAASDSSLASSQGASRGGSSSESSVPLRAPVRRVPHRTVRAAGARNPPRAPPTEVEARLRAQRDLHYVNFVRADEKGQRLKAQVAALTKEHKEAQEQLGEATAKLLDTEAQLAETKAELEKAKEAVKAKEDAVSQGLGEMATELAGERPAAELRDLHKVLNKPLPYDGSNQNCHIVDWLVAMFHFLVTLRVPVALYVTTAATYLRGEALRYWTNRVEALPSAQGRSWDVFKEALLERFDSENTAASSRIKLDQLQQGTLSMVKFVQRFDHITSYIPDMSDADLIHRFLEAVNVECKISLQNDPSTGVRWTGYAKLRKFALNMFPADSTFRRPKLKGHADTRAAAAAAAATGTVEKVKKKLLGARGGVNKPTHKGASTSAGTPKVYTNSNGLTCRRSPQQKAAIWEANVCGFCYKKGHRAEACTASQPAKGMPEQE